MRHRIGPARKLLMLLAVLAMVAAACSNDSESASTSTTTQDNGSSTTTSGEETTTSTPPAGPEGTLRVGIINDIQSFDPFSRAAPQWPIVQNIYDTLVRYTPDQEAIPGLATSWEFSDDSSSMTLILQPEATWHSGNDVTANDIVANFERAMVEETGANMFAVTKPIASISAVDDDTVLIEFDGPLPTRAGTDILQQVPMVDPEYFDRLANEASGTGPFKLESWDPGIQLTLTANEDYWGDGPFVRTIEFTVFSDPDALVAAVQSGQSVDVAIGVPPKDATSIGGGYEVLRGAPGGLVLDLRINTAGPPFDNKTVRQALSWHAVNREGIVQAVLFGQSIPSLTPFDAGPFLDVSFGMTKEFDLDQAQAMLDQAGIDLTGVEVEMLVDTRFSDVTALAQILKSDWEKLGLVVTLTPGDQVFDRFLESDFQVLPSITANGNRYPLVFFGGSLYRFEANPAFEGGVPPQEWFDIFDELSSALDPAAQESAAADMVEYFVDEAWALTIADRPTLFAVAGNVSGFDYTIDSMPVFQRVVVSG